MVPSTELPLIVNGARMAREMRVDTSRQARFFGSIEVVGDGSRRITGGVGPYRSRTEEESRESHLRFANQGTLYVCFFDHPTWAAEGFVEADDGRGWFSSPPQAPRMTPGRYFGYDFGVYDEQVNQVHDYNIWEAHICQFAHELSQLPAHTHIHMNKSNVHVTPDMEHDTDSSERWKFTWMYARALVGNAYNRLASWGELDPADTAGVWKIVRDSNIRPMMERLCEDCDNPFWARQLLTRMNVEAWRTALTPLPPDSEAERTRWEVTLPRLNKDTWLPDSGFHVRAHAPYDPNSYWRGWIGGYERAIRAYDDKYASRT